MKKRIKVFLEKPFIKNVIMLSSGSAIAQVISMAFSPLLTRIFGPTAYGIMGTFSAVTSIFIPIAALSYPISIVLPKDDEDSKLLMKLSFIITTLFTSIVFLVVLLFNQEISIVFNITSISSYLYLVPLVVFFSGVSQILEQWLMREQRFNILSKTLISESLVTNISKASIGLFYPHPSVLVIFTALKRGVKSTFYFLFYKKYLPKPSINIKLNRKKIIKIAIKYRDFPLFRAPHQFLNSITTSLPSLFLSSFFGPTATGFYSIGRTVLGVPSFLIGKSVGDVFYPQISKAANSNKQITPLILKSTKYLGVVGLLPYLIIILIGPWLFAIIFGGEWDVAGEYARWMAVWIFTDFLRLPSINTLPVISKQSLLLVYTVFLLAMQSGSFLLGYYIYDSDMIAVALFSIVGAILNIGLIIITINLCKKYDAEL